MGQQQDYRQLGDSYAKREWPWEKLKRLWFEAGADEKDKPRYCSDDDIWRGLLGM